MSHIIRSVPTLLCYIWMFFLSWLLDLLALSLRPGVTHPSVCSHTYMRPQSRHTHTHTHTRGLRVDTHTHIRGLGVDTQSALHSPALLSHPGTHEVHSGLFALVIPSVLAISRLLVLVLISVLNSACPDHPI